MLTELNKRASFNKYRYLLVDNLVVLNSVSPLSHKGLQSLYGEEKSFGERKLTTVLRTDLDYDPSVCPTLVMLAEPYQFLEQAIIDKITMQATVECFWSKRYICAFIVTDLKPSILAKQIINIGNNIAKTLRQRYYPFFEPFRMQFLHESGSDQDNAWLKAQFSQIENYYYPSIHNGEFIRYTNDDKPIIEKKWNTQYCERLKKIRVIRTLVNAWANNRTQFEEQKNVPLEKQVIIQATQLIEQADKLGLTDVADILFWGLNGLRYQHVFTTHPQVLEQIPKAQQSPSTLSKHVIDANINLEI
ncbi:MULTISPECIES: hypothetical protein [unclassified Gilliamella]|uniref:hypothetical protein n=1 Tax=unclassified Gilliamella TaxID=2685620 RepID=UPI00226995A6|nr:MULTISPECIES: hypothetical protein [unclassified Gilliamella]MCX8600289.1 hypothetical protein [Gilliamella sp. B3722]MCX8609285.1 hypothetical protein [Gilliamella sp. B3771]MCX8609504.1 hypothetical protein [Gilliamella sp. B3891]MCX8612407.1 hypothetical protein [Gilliamella sp. B3773]MCX8615827.1 hypothetical protein [Gilliamella sp. B3770]